MQHSSFSLEQQLWSDWARYHTSCWEWKQKQNAPYITFALLHRVLAFSFLGPVIAYSCPQSCCFLTLKTLAFSSLKCIRLCLQFYFHALKGYTNVIWLLQTHCYATCNTVLFSDKSKTVPTFFLPRGSGDVICDYSQFFLFWFGLFLK